MLWKASSLASAVASRKRCDSLRELLQRAAERRLVHVVDQLLEVLLVGVLGQQVHHLLRCWR